MLGGSSWGKVHLDCFILKLYHKKIVFKLVENIWINNYYHMGKRTMFKCLGVKTWPGVSIGKKVTQK